MILDIELDPNESDVYALWAEIIRLRAAAQGPAGYVTWQDAAVAERMLRVKATDEVVRLLGCGDENERLKAELAQWATWGTIEVAVRNSSVSEYMRHWESRATKAEAENTELRKELLSYTAALCKAVAQ